MTRRASAPTKVRMPTGRAGRRRDDEEQEHADARQAGVGAQHGGKPWHRLPNAGQHEQRVGVGEDEYGQGELRPAVPEDQGDHAGRQLALAIWTATSNTEKTKTMNVSRADVSVPATA